MAELRHPFRWLPESLRTRALGILIIVTLALMLILGGFSRSLETEVAPRGIVSFELARDLETAAAVVESWSRGQRLDAAFQIGLDYLYLVVYPLCLGLGCTQIAETMHPRWRAFAVVGVAVAWLQLAAGLLDAIENWAMYRTLLGADQAAWPVVAWLCAVPKFAIVILGLLYVAAGLVALRVTRGRRPGPSNDQP